MDQVYYEMDAALMSASREIVDLKRQRDALRAIAEAMLDEDRLKMFAGDLRDFPNEPPLTILRHCFPEIDAAIAAAQVDKDDRNDT